MWTRKKKKNVRLFHLDQLYLMLAVSSKSLSLRHFFLFIPMVFFCHLQSVDFCAFLSQFKRVFVSSNKKTMTTKNQTAKQNLIQLFLSKWHCVWLQVSLVAAQKPNQTPSPWKIKIAVIFSFELSSHSLDMKESSSFRICFIFWFFEHTANMCL